MKDTVYFIIQLLLGVVIVVGLAIGAVKCVREEEETEWNDGYCECGGHWVYEQAVGHAYSTSYLYRCDECGKTIDIKMYMQGVRPVYPVKRPGEWELRGERYYCSECGEEAIDLESEPEVYGHNYCLTKFCPNCGVDMRGEEK